MHLVQVLANQAGLIRVFFEGGVGIFSSSVLVIFRPVLRFWQRKPSIFRLLCLLRFWVFPLFEHLVFGFQHTSAFSDLVSNTVFGLTYFSPYPLFVTYASYRLRFWKSGPANFAF